MLGGRWIGLFLVFLLILVPLSFAQANWYDDVYVWLFLAVLISSAVLGLAYMAARLFEVQMLEAWVKIELGELFASIIIAALCVGLIASVNTSAQFLVGGESSQDIVDIARHDFLRDEVYADGKKIYHMLGQAYFNLAKVSSFAFSAGVSAYILSFGYSMSPAAGMSPLVAEIGQGMDAVSNFMLIAAAQSAFLLFFKNAAVVLLPAGIFLRSFSLTRKVGGVVLAGVIATVVIYPAAFMISREVYSAFSTPMLDHISAYDAKLVRAENPPSSSVVCNPFMQQVISGPCLAVVAGETCYDLIICSGPQALAGCHAIITNIFIILKAAYPIIMYLLVFMPFTNNLADPDLPEQYYQPIFDHALPMVSQYAVLSLIVFLIPIIVTITLVRNLALAFGGEPQLYGLSKLV